MTNDWDDLSGLTAGLSSEDATERARSAERLARLGPEARAAAVPLVRAAGDPHESVAEWAMGALEEMGPPAADETAALAELSRDANADVAWWAVTLLGRLGPDAAPAVPTLVEILRQSPEANVRQRAAWALGRIGHDEPPITEALETAAAGDDPRLARLAADALEQLRD